MSSTLHSSTNFKKNHPQINFPEMSISGLINPNPRFLSSLSSSSSPKFTPKLTPKSKFRVSAKVASPEPNAKIHSQFSAPSSATASKKDDQDKREYYLNLGYAIRSLREEFPELFYREPRFDIYREDIVFKDPLNTFTGIENYKTVFWALRFHGRIFFKALWVDILSVWQPMENVILIRWTVHGIPRVPWESRGRFDGLSEYKLDKNGKIYEHKVDNIALNTLGKFKVVSVEELILSLSRPSTPKPTCFELSSSSSTESVTSTRLMESVSHYLDSALDMSNRHEAETSQKT
ncbi:hypothetical protein RND81_01G192600 [Saponaria officinalis]|uniref:Uncharacterized protein n=1 Tax=Saponaria officinalis TaxID=3572 RepID=A0AAW1NGF5_SAPOF